MTRWGFRTKLILAIAFPLLAIAVFLAVYFPNREADAAQGSLEVRAQLLAEKVTPLLATTLDADLPAEQAEEQLRALEAAVYAVVLKPDGTVFARLADK